MAQGTPLAAFVGAHPGGATEGRKHVLRGFRRRGWPCTDVAVGYWISGERVPRFTNQVRLERVTDGKVKPEHWAQYQIDRMGRRAG